MIKIHKIYIKKEIIKSFYFSYKGVDGYYDLAGISSKELANKFNFIENMVESSSFELQLMNDNMETFNSQLFILINYLEFEAISFLENILASYLCSKSNDLLDMHARLNQHYLDLSEDEQIIKYVKNQNDHFLIRQKQIEKN